jgi:hypothetical protein
MGEIGQRYDKETLLRKIQNFSDKQLSQDLAQFLPLSQKKSFL